MVLGTLFYIFVKWNQDFSKKYFNVSAYKVVTIDPNDDIIPLMSSVCVDAMSEYLAYKYESEVNYG